MSATSVKTYAGQAARWMSTTDAGDAIGVTSAFLRKLCRGDDGSPMPHRTRADGSYEVQPGAAYDFIVARGGRLPPDLHPPTDYSSTPSASPPPDETTQYGITDPHELLLRIATSAQFRETFTPQDIQALRGVANELRLKRESDAKAAALLKPDVVVDMLRDHRALYVEEIEGSAAADAAELVKLIARDFNVDLSAQNVAAVRILEVFLRERANRVIKAVNDRVEEQIAGVHRLEFGHHAATGSAQN